MNKNLKQLISCGSKNIVDPNDLESLYNISRKSISQYVHSSKHAAIALYVYKKYDFYKKDGKKSFQEYLQEYGFSKGTISHLLKYGEFCCSMNFTEEQLPPESLVRPLLTGRDPSVWKDLYTAACQKHYQESVRSKKVKNSTAEAGPDNYGEIGYCDRGSAEDEHNGSLPEVLHDDPQKQPSKIFDFVPSCIEIKDVLKEYRNRNKDTCYLSCIGEIICHNDDLVSGILEKFRKKLKTVQVLSAVISELRKSGRELTKDDEAAVVSLGTSIHQAEMRKLKEIIQGTTCIEEENNEEDSD